MTARDEIAEVILDASRNLCDLCGPDDYCAACRHDAGRAADALLASPALANLTRERATTREDLAAAWDDGFTYATRLAYGGPMRDGDPNPYRGTGCSDPTCTEEHSHDR